MGEFSREELWRFNLFSMSGRLPDFVVLFEISREELLKRREGIEADNIESRGLDYAIEVQNNLKRWILESGVSSITVNASDSIESIATQIENGIKELKVKKRDL